MADNCAPLSKQWVLQVSGYTVSISSVHHRSHVTYSTVVFLVNVPLRVKVCGKLVYKNNMASYGQEAQVVPIERHFIRRSTVHRTNHGADVQFYCQERIDLLVEVKSAIIATTTSYVKLSS